MHGFEGNVRAMWISMFITAKAYRLMFTRICGLKESWISGLRDCRIKGLRESRIL